MLHPAATIASIALLLACTIFGAARASGPQPIVLFTSAFYTLNGEADWIDVSWIIETPPTLANTNDVVAVYPFLPGGKTELNVTAQEPLAFIYPFLANQSAFLAGRGSHRCDHV